MALDLTGPTAPYPGFNVLRYKDPEHWFYMLIAQNMMYRAQLQALPNPMLFTDTSVGTIYTQTLTLRNVGVRNLVFRAIDLEGQGYEIVNVIPRVIVPGGQFLVTIRFTPTEWKKAYPGSITFISNGKGGDVVVALIGNSKEEPGQLYFDPDPIYVDLDGKGQLYFDPNPIYPADVAAGQLYFDPDPITVILDIGTAGEIGLMTFDPDFFIVQLDSDAPIEIFPDPPTSVTAIAGPLNARVSFTPPANAVASGVTSYTVISIPPGVVANGTSSPITLNGLTEGVPYTFRIVSNGTLGVSVPSNSSNSVVPLPLEPVDPIDPAIPTPAVGRLGTYGNQIIDSDQRRIRLRTANWFGAEGSNYTPHGTWQVRWTSLIDNMLDMGFNCIRLPFSGEFRFPDKAPPVGAFRVDLNPDLVGKTSLEIFDLIIEYAGNRGMYIVLDHHRRSAGAGADGSPIDSYGYDLATWISTWEVMANRYKDNKAVIGADIHNEPHDLTWNTWASYSEQCGNAIHNIVPHWLIFVEGVGNYAGENYWWGGMLKGVSTRPVVLTVPNRVVYSPHEYGQSVGSQPWLAYDGGSVPVGWPNNLYAVWDNAWGFIFKNNIAPLWIGEFGGHFGVDGLGANTKAHSTYERQWCSNLVRYYNGLYTGGATVPALTGNDKGMSFAYWSLNPNSGDTGGLLQDDWVSQQPVKVNLIKPLMPMGPWRTKGNQILDAADRPFRIKSVTWSGAESSTHVPGGLSERSYTAIIDDVKTMGFNTLRIPFGGSFANASLGVTGGAISGTFNPTLVGLNAWQVLDKVVQYANTIGVFIILDYHNASDTGGVDGGPVAGAGVTTWETTWEMMATRYVNQNNVMGADLYNEPINYQWNEWAALAEDTAELIHAIAPRWLIFVEGVATDGTTSYWDGGFLKGVLARPITLTTPNTVVYSPHDFGQTIGPRDWLSRPGNVVANYPDNLYAVFSENWGYIYEQEIAPIWLGEFGGSFGFNSAGILVAPYTTYSTEETQWCDTLVKYLNGNFTGTSPELPDGKKGMSFSYFCLNNASPPLGLIKTGTAWAQTIPIKLARLSPLFNDGENFVPGP